MKVKFSGVNFLEKVGFFEGFPTLFFGGTGGVKGEDNFIRGYFTDKVSDDV